MASLQPKVQRSESRLNSPLPIKISSVRWPGDRIEIEASLDRLAPRSLVPVRIHRASGAVEAFEAIAAVETSLEISLLQSGGVLPLILNRALKSKAVKPDLAGDGNHERSPAHRRLGADRPAR